jgi:hypothetical protein
MNVQSSVKSVSRSDCEQQGGKLVRLLFQLRPRIRPLLDRRSLEHLLVKTCLKGTVSGDDIEAF